MKDSEHKEFVGFYNNLYPQGYCQHLIDEFERLQENGAGSNRQKSENTNRHVKDDYQINIEIKNHNLTPFQEKDPCNLFFGGLQTCYNEYTARYSVLRDNGNIRATIMKMQKTGPGGGYHVWHGEQGSGPNANRVVVYMLYLNSLETGDGGETEFLYQRMRIEPKENLMLLWPAAYTHAHRGNPVLAEKFKYIVTGWFYYD